MSTLSNSLIKNYIKILDTGTFFDIEILVGVEPNVKIFRLHSFILKICSPYFHNVLSNKKQIKIENNIIKIKKQNISVEIFEIIIKYIYGGNLESEKHDFKTNAALLIAADELHVSLITNRMEVGMDLAKKYFINVAIIKDLQLLLLLLKDFNEILGGFNPCNLVQFMGDDFVSFRKEKILKQFTKNRLDKMKSIFKVDNYEIFQL
ncbi:BTB/POZ protein [Rhizophagus clarus]|uniref:BTB/POZ protein n=1 Tax=Rhizophagus clarus TaxID=94130 RepID=A0A8H3M8C7_9GLOM|nr:BTB/POZ protein [Rhizophagus clarus]